MFPGAKLYPVEQAEGQASIGGERRRQPSLAVILSIRLSRRAR